MGVVDWRLIDLAINLGEILHHHRQVRRSARSGAALLMVWRGRSEGLRLLVVRRMRKRLIRALAMREAI
jgi:hypothetical protein